MSLAAPSLHSRISAIGVPVLAGRFVAWCAHPFAAWQVVSWSRRALIVSGYFAAAYLATIVALQFVRPL